MAMNRAIALAICAILSGCGHKGAGDQTTPTSKAPPQKVNPEMLGLRIGQKNNLPQCATDQGGGDYNVPSLQPTTPCWMSLVGPRAANDPIPETDPFIGIIFKQTQVPQGISTEAWANVRDGNLVRLALFQDKDAQAAWLISVPQLLRERFGPPTLQLVDGVAEWRTENLVVNYYPTGEPPSIFVTTPSFEAYKAEQAKRSHAQSF